MEQQQYIGGTSVTGLGICWHGKESVPGWGAEGGDLTDASYLCPESAPPPAQRGAGRPLHGRRGRPGSLHPASLRPHTGQPHPDPGFTSPGPCVSAGRWPARYKQTELTHPVHCSLTAPHCDMSLPPQMSDFYSTVRRHWCAGKAELRNVTVLSVGGGHRDYQVRSGLTALPCPHGDPSKLSMVVSGSECPRHMTAGSECPRHMTVIMPNDWQANTMLMCFTVAVATHPGPPAVFEWAIST